MTGRARACARRLALALLPAALAGCLLGIDTDKNGDPSLLVGTGARRFAALREGDALSFFEAPDGGYHAFLALRAINLAAGALRVDLTVTLDGAPVGALNAIRNFIATDPGASELAGIEVTLVPGGDACGEPRALVGRAVTVTAEVVDRNGEAAAQVITVRPSCLQQRAVNACTPDDCALFCSDGCVRCDPALVPAPVDGACEPGGS